MKIEDNWTDVELVNVEFLGFNNEVYARTMIVPSGHSEEEVKAMLLEEFPPVQKYLAIDFPESGFFYKGNYFKTSCSCVND